MPTITFVSLDGSRVDLEVPVGRTLMEAATMAGVPGILAVCGGACSCATCHVHVDAAWAERIGQGGATEMAMLDFAENLADTSRLSCQIKATAEMDGLVVHVAQG